MNDSWILTKIAMGIRHDRTFSISDLYGEIIDGVVPLQGHGPYPVDCFRKVGRSADRNSIIIRDEEDTLSINCGIDGVILECDMQAEPPIPVENLQAMFSEIVSIVIPLSEAKNKINRLGIIHQYLTGPFDNSAKKLLSELLHVDLKGTPDNVHIRFALKNPTSAAIFEPEKKADYKNVIIEVASRKPDEKTTNFPSQIAISIDYQIYYDPVRPLKNVDLKDHFFDADRYISTAIKSSNLHLQPVLVKHG